MAMATAERDGCISADELYTLPELRRRTGLGVAALRTARRAGLDVRYIGGRGFVAGQDWIEYVRTHGKDCK